MGLGSTSVIQVTNIAPTVTNEQIRTLLALVGAIREFIVYPSNDPAQVMSRVCYVKYTDPTSVSVAQHLTNTVFIDRAIFVKPVTDGKIPDEILALKLANEGHSQNSSNSGVVSQIANVNGTQSITTIDPRLNALGLPQYPPLPANLDPSKIEEIRRTVSVSNISQYSTPEDILQFFNQFGEIKYLRMTSNEGDLIKSALIEFTDQSSVANALQNTGTTLNGSQLSINHTTISILKPQHNMGENDKTNDVRESKFKQERPKDSKSPVSSRRSRSPSRRSRSPRRSRRRSVSRSRSRDRDRDRRRTSRSRERRRSVERRKSRSYSKDRNRERSRRGRSKDRDRNRSRDRSIERGRSKERRRSRERRREHSRDRRSKDRDKERSSRRRDGDRSRDSERRDRHRGRRERERGRSRSRSKSKNLPDKQENHDARVETIKPEQMDTSTIKRETDNYSVKSDDGSSSHKSASPRRSSSRARSQSTKEIKQEKLYDSGDE